MPKSIRNIPGQNVQDPSSIDNIVYNDAAGANKVSQVGTRLLPIPLVTTGVTSYVTDASTNRVLPKKGALLAVYNNSVAIHSVTLGESAAQTSLAAGITDATGHVGIPCPAGQWTYIACGTSQYVITDDAVVMVFLVDDASYYIPSQN